MMSTRDTARRVGHMSGNISALIVWAWIEVVDDEYAGQRQAGWSHVGKYQCSYCVGMDGGCG